MSSKPTSRRKPETETPEEELVMPEEPAETVAEAEQPEEVAPEQHVVDAVVERENDELYLVDSLVGAARQMFGVNPEVVVGALSHADIHEKATTAQVRAAINTYLTLPV